MLALITLARDTILLPLPGYVNFSLAKAKNMKKAFMFLKQKPREEKYVTFATLTRSRTNHQ
jgi:hypothetical protein